MNRSFPKGHLLFFLQFMLLKKVNRNQNMLYMIYQTTVVDQYIIQIYHYKFIQMWSKYVIDDSHECGKRNSKVKGHE